MKRGMALVQVKTRQRAVASAAFEEPGDSATPSVLAQNNETNAEGDNHTQDGVINVMLNSELQIGREVKHMIDKDQLQLSKLLYPKTSAKQGGGSVDALTSELQNSGAKVEAVSHQHVFKLSSNADPVMYTYQQAKHSMLNITSVNEKSGHKHVISYSRISLMGLIYGFIHAIAPDHMGTLLTLSAVEKPLRAFNVGAAWGLGHCIGMAGIAAVFILLQKATNANLAMWEHLGDYLIGASMIACALYFIFREGSYLEERDDGTCVAIECSCHGDSVGKPADSATPPPPRVVARKSRFSVNFCAKYKESKVVCPPCPPVENPMKRGPAELSMPSPKVEGSDNLREAYGATLGLFQGICCPMGLLGITFLANLPVGGILLFSISFSLCSALGTGFIAMSWAYLTTYGLGTSFLTPRVVYRACCTCTLVFGIVWIAANYFGVIEQLDYTEVVSIDAGAP